MSLFKKKDPFRDDDKPQKPVATEQSGQPQAPVGHPSSTPTPPRHPEQDAGEQQRGEQPVRPPEGAEPPPSRHQPQEPASPAPGTPAPGTPAPGTSSGDSPAAHDSRPADPLYLSPAAAKKAADAAKAARKNELKAEKKKATEERKAARTGIFGRKTASGTKLTVAQMLSGRRRWTFIRRAFIVLVGLAVIFLAFTVGGKASRTEVGELVDKRIAETGNDFPAGQAATFVSPIIKTFATYSPDASDSRRIALEPYTGNGLDPQLGWNGEGTQVAIDMMVSSHVTVLTEEQDPRCADSACAVLDATVQVENGSWRCIATPVYALSSDNLTTTAFGLLQAPTYVPCGGVTAPPKVNNNGAPNDNDLADEFRRAFLPQYMHAWAAGDSSALERFILPGLKSLGLGGAFTGAGEGGVPEIGDVYVPSPAPENGIDENERLITFEVTFLALDGKATQQSRYQVPMKQESGQWYVTADPVPAYSDPGVGGGSPNEPEPTTSTTPQVSPPPYPTPPETEGSR